MSKAKNKTIIKHKTLVLTTLVFALLMSPLIIQAVTHTIKLQTQASGSTAGEAESATRSGDVTPVSDTNASGGQYVKLGSVPTIGAERFFTGDFETGNVKQWTQCQAVFMNALCSGYNNTHYGMQTQSAIKRQGNYATRFELRDGDIPNFGGGERSEVNIDVAKTRAAEGQDTWYQWSTQFAPNFPVTGWGAVVSQWHDDSNNPPPLGFYALDANTFALQRHNVRVASKLWTTPLNPGKWHDIKMHVMWSTDPAKGYIELWHNGVRQTFTGTICSGQTRCYFNTRGIGGHYFKQGYYRDSAHTATGVLYLDGFTVSSTEAGLGNL